MSKIRERITALWNMGAVLFAMNVKEEIFKSIQTMVDRAIANCKVDRTYRIVIKRIEKNGYVIIDQAGQERTVSCGIPNVELRPMQSVYVKEPMGKLNELHICNVVGKHR